LFEIPAAYIHQFIAPKSFTQAMERRTGSPGSTLRTAYCHSYAQVFFSGSIHASTRPASRNFPVEAFFSANLFKIHPGCSQINSFWAEMSKPYSLQSIRRLHSSAEVFDRDEARRFFQHLAACNITSPNMSMIISRNRITKIA
jgi:hypothetical protein